MTKRKYINGLIKISDKPDVFWKKGTIFIVIANRFSNPETHSYPVGAYLGLETAISNANKEVCNRGGKYGCVIYATQHTNKFKDERLVEIYEIESPYKKRFDLTRFA